MRGRLVWASPSPGGAEWANLHRSVSAAASVRHSRILHLLWRREGTKEEEDSPFTATNLFCVHDRGCLSHDCWMKMIWHGAYRSRAMQKFPFILHEWGKIDRNIFLHFHQSFSSFSFSYSFLFLFPFLSLFIISSFFLFVFFFLFNWFFFLLFSIFSVLSLSWSYFKCSFLDCPLKILFPPFLSAFRFFLYSFSFFLSSLTLPVFNSGWRLESMA